MSSLSLKQYDNLEEYLSVLKPHFAKHEVQNTIIHEMIKKAISEQTSDNSAPQFNLAVWNDNNELVFALFYLFSTTSLYGSFLLDGQPEAVHLCLEKFVSQGHINTMTLGHAFEPGLSIMVNYLNGNSKETIKPVDEVWAHTCSQVTWSGKPLALKNNPLTEFKPATKDLLETIELWSANFMNHYVVNHGAPVRPISSLHIPEMIEAGTIFVLWYDGKPVSMAWQRRPTQNGCAISFVYTPDELRGHGYAGCCVGMLTEKILQDFKYATLFIIRAQDPTNNLYTRAGFKHIDAAGRMYIEGREALH